MAPKPFKPRAPRSENTSTGPDGFESGPRPPRPPRRPRPDHKGPLRIIYEDDDVVVVDKPAGLLTADATGSGLEDLFGHIKDHVRQVTKRRGTRVWIIHRLDREASGLLVFAKTESAFTHLKEQFRSKKAHRIYLAVCRGEFEPAKATSTSDRTTLPMGTVQSMLVERPDTTVDSLPLGAIGGRRSLKDERRPMPGKQARDQAAAEPKLAITHYRVLATGRGRSLVQVRLETGRKHQIRVHMASLGHGLVGDHKYGIDPTAPKEHEDQRLCLHGHELAFVHPGTGQTKRFFSPAPAHFYELCGSKPPANARHDEPVPGSATAPAETSASIPASRATASGPRSDWNHVADWYDDLIEDRVSDHHEQVLIPGALRLLELSPGMRVLDVACGQGAFCRRLTSMGVHAVGVDAAERLIEFARAASSKEKAKGTAEYHVGDARALDGLSNFDRATCIMALMNIEPLAPVFEGVCGALKPGGLFVAILLHPAFRQPGQTSWGWEQGRTGHVQYRRVDRYLGATQQSIVMNPGAVASGKAPVTTLTFHRPISSYIGALAQAGLVVDALEEWSSTRTSEPGPRAEAENTARREIPMFLAIRARKPS
ncbi:MAG: methyltransferase domain-containing protein [Planctomycetes bacterium]|nr:methyltransferase domain-containing protein [Planctomycetota bacterium]